MPSLCDLAFLSTYGSPLLPIQQLLRELVHRARTQRGALPLDGLVDAQRRAVLAEEVEAVAHLLEVVGVRRVQRRGRLEELERRVDLAAA